jgi:subtilisin family serine protease
MRHRISLGAFTGRSGARARLLALVLGSMLALIALPAALTWASEAVAPPEDSSEVAEGEPSGEAENGGDGAQPPGDESAEEEPADEEPSGGEPGEEEPPADAEGGEPAETEPMPGPDSAADQLPADLPEDAEARDGEILVRFRRGAEVDEREEARDEVGAEVEESLPVPDLQLVSVDSASVSDEVDELEEDPAVLYAEPNFERSVERTPNDDEFPLLYGLNNTGQDFGPASGTPDADIDAPEAWDDTVGSEQVKVAVVDTGIDGTHPDLTPNLDEGAGYDFFADGDSDPTDENGHGTHVAGTIGAQGNNDEGVTGVNWETSLIAVRAFGADGSGRTSDVIQAYAYADSIGADVLNASFGGTGFSQAESDAIARASDTLFVAAAGNEGRDNDATPSYPCNYDRANVICVAASDQNDQLASFSNYGNSVDLAAPGVNILSTRLGGGYRYLSGTSMATPHVAGTAALVAAVRPNSSPAELRDDLLDGVDVKPTLTSVGSSGRVNADRSVAAAGVGGNDVGTGAPPPDPVSPSPSPTPQPSPETGSGGGSTGGGDGSDDGGGSGGGGSGGGGGGSGGSGGGGGGSGGGVADPGVAPVLPVPGTMTPAPAARRPSRCSRLRGVRRTRCVRRARALARCRKLAPAKRRACVVRAPRASGR